MFKASRIFLYLPVLLAAILMGTGCQNADDQEGIHVMFEGTPKIYHPGVVFHGLIIGEIQDQQLGRGRVSKITIRIDPQFFPYAGRHWAFYVENGRLKAGKINNTGNSIKAGDLVCGFTSKAAFTWFKIKTLLNNRIAKANRRANKLYMQFQQSA